VHALANVSLAERTVSQVHESARANARTIAHAYFTCGGMCLRTKVYRDFPQNAPHACINRARFA
jgi:hypothetical protein